jgi:hypothetical protein
MKKVCTKKPGRPVKNIVKQINAPAETIVKSMYVRNRNSEET